jgi:hypothetical protein
VIYPIGYRTIFVVLNKKFDPGYKIWQLSFPIHLISLRGLVFEQITFTPSVVHL